MEGLSNIFSTEKLEIFRRYMKQIVLLLIVTCIVSFLAQTLVVRGVYKMYVGQGPSMNFSYWNNSVNNKIPAARSAKKYTTVKFEHINSEVFGTLQKGVTQFNRKRTTEMNGQGVSAILSNMTSFMRTKGFTVNETAVDISKIVRNGGKAITNDTFVNPYVGIVSKTISGDIRNQWSESNGKALAIFILSAIGYNSTTIPGFKQEIKLNGWQGAKHSKVTIKCCVLWKNKEKTEYVSPNKTTRGKRLSLIATQITCPVKGPWTDIFGVTLEFARRKCPVNETEYIMPFIPMLQTKRNSFAICLKILYGNIDNKLLIDWIEFYRGIKVDKLFMFVYNITVDTRNIIRFYEHLGFLETRQFAFPWKNGRDVGMKNPVVWEDEQVVVYDCFYRLHGYTYIAIVDLDEFILPRKHDNVKDMMEYLMQTFPKAAGFAMKTFIFNKAWGVSGRINGSDIAKYIQRTPALAGVRARAKNILILSRVPVDRHLNTHEFNTKSGYESYTINESIVAVNHYRVCYKNIVHMCNKRRRIIDTEIFKVVEKFKNRTRLITLIK